MMSVVGRVLWWLRGVGECGFSRLLLFFAWCINVGLCWW